jgi:hypothetical protein
MGRCREERNLCQLLGIRLRHHGLRASNRAPYRLSHPSSLGTVQQDWRWRRLAWHVSSSALSSACWLSEAKVWNVLCGSCVRLWGTVKLNSHHKPFRMWGSHNCDYEDIRVTPCNPLKSRPTFRRNMSTQPSEWKNKPTRNQLETKNCTPCIPLKVNSRFGGIFRLDLQGQRISHARNHLKTENYLLGYNAVYSVENQLMFRRNILPQSSGSKNKPSKKPAWSRELSSGL